MPPNGTAGLFTRELLVFTTGVNLPFTEADLFRAALVANRRGLIRTRLFRNTVSVDFGNTGNVSISPQTGRVFKVVEQAAITASLHDASLLVDMFVDINDANNRIFRDLPMTRDIGVGSEEIPFIRNTLTVNLDNQGAFPSTTITLDADVFDFDQAFFDNFVRPISAFEFEALEAFVSEMTQRQ